MLKSVKLMLCIFPVIATPVLIAIGPSAAEPQELKVTEHNTTQTITDIGASGDSAGDILTFGQNEVFLLTTRTRSASTRASATASCRARLGSASGRWPWIRAN
jgi:hypothetical protein